ncbi:uncharacterized protein LOC133909821 [Phragmites australis]|uniref:uncharacterized protein LOC133909821 n=1 Tax=Phragmites australis TaxID=29695 RepID=UPI002D77D1B8|nr:uncharacterized protein LOC133909821 [Phragmites australis]
MGGCLASPRRVGEPSEEGESTFLSSRSPSCCVAFQSRQINGKRPYYLCYDARSGAAAGSSGRSLRLNGESVTSPCSRFYIEPSRVHAGLVHIRCCYDNKYWVAQQRQHEGGWAIIGGADEPEEDLSKPTCTLFKTTRVPPHSIRLLHVHRGKYACLPSSSDDNMIRLLETVSPSLLTGDKEDAIATFTVHDLSEQFVLPRYLAFKGDNGMYLRARTVERYPYLQFSGRDVGDQAVLNTIHTNDDGTFRVRSSHVGKFWRRSPNWIWTDSTGDPTDDTLFRAIRLSGAGFFALQNLGNEYFCKRLTTEGKRSCLNAGTPTITADARLQLEEAVVSRQIYNVVFDLSEPRIYGRSVVTMATASALNGTTSNNTAKLILAYTDTEKRTWVSTVTLKLGVAATICTGVPVIVAGGSVEVSAEFSGLYSWGSPVEKETTQKVAYEVTVPPKTRVTVASTATRAFCDVPFSYTQRDTLFDGRQVTYDMDDGLYTGVNCYDFKYVTSEENI